MSIEVAPESVTAVGEEYRQVGAAVADTHGALRAVADQAAAAASNQHVSAGLAAFHGVVGGALRTLAERTDRHGRKVAAAAATYQDTDRRIGDAAARQRGTSPSG